MHKKVEKWGEKVGNSKWQIASQKRRVFPQNKFVNRRKD
jgi:hypothetical protein